jgi:alanyl-tRNA synthetase
MGSLMKQTVSKFGGRGGGSKDMAQGGLSDPAMIDAALQAASASLRA